MTTWLPEDALQRLGSVVSKPPQEATPEVNAVVESERLGSLAILRGHLTAAQVEEALTEQRCSARNGQAPAPFGAILLKRRWLSPEALALLLRELARADASVPDIPRYEICERMGEGASSTVYWGLDRELKRPVAIKILVATAHGQMRQRFLQEARVLARLSHPNIVAVYDVGESDDRPYIVMELVQGESLSDLMRSSGTSVRSMATILEKVARGVHYVHENGIVHRDLKPSNILIGQNEEPKVADFGLAHAPFSESPLTKTNAILGTPQYMAPEQVEGRAKEIDARTDVYALGVILYEIITRCLPHQADTLAKLYWEIMHSEPTPPRRIVRTVERDLETICLKAMESSRDRRYPTALALAEDLRRHREGELILARPASVVTKTLKWTNRHRALTAVTGVVLAGLIVLMGVMTARAVRFQARIRDMEARAKAAEDARLWTEAADLYGQLKILAPENAQATGKYVEMRVAAEAARKRQAAKEFLGRARQARLSYQESQDDLKRLRAEEQALSSTVESDAGEEKKQPLWTLRRQISDKEQLSAVHYSDMITFLTAAFGADPENKDARSSLAALYFAEYECAEAAGDTRAMEASRRLVLLYDNGTYAPRLINEGTIEVDSKPSGAEAELLRYDEGSDRRLIAKPIRSLGRCPIPETKLEGGSWLLILRKEGYRDVRYPVLVGRGTHHLGLVRLYTDGEIGRQFVYVPAGKFIQGGDPQAIESLARDPEAKADDFFISKYEVTLEEYVEFLNAIIAEKGPKAAQRHIPRQSPYGSYIWEIPATAKSTILPSAWIAKWPVMGISWEDAHAYCEWRTKKAKERGESVTYRLPTSVEWEKAARGVDGRHFPWGNHFDWSFTNGEESRRAEPDGRKKMEEIGAFEKDQSPYGVYDMAGSMREYCENWYNENRGLKWFRGGTWLDTEVRGFRCANRFGVGTLSVRFHDGFRVVSIPGAP